MNRFPMHAVIVVRAEKRLVSSLCKGALMFAALFCAIGAAGSPYGKALNKARSVAGTGGQLDLKQVYAMLTQAAESNHGVLPGPAGAPGIARLCSSGRLSPRLLGWKSGDPIKEKTFSFAYVGSELGPLGQLPRAGEFPILFTKPGREVKTIQVLFADGTVKPLQEPAAKSCAGVINVLKRRARSSASPVWERLAAAAARIDRR